MRNKIIMSVLAVWAFGFVIAVLLAGCELLPKDPYGSNKEFFEQRTRWGF